MVARKCCWTFPRYDFNWQTSYRFAAGKKRCPPGRASIASRTSTIPRNNLNNPDPEGDGALGRSDVERDDDRIL